MTIAEAAESLHVSEQRVHQLLRESALESVALPAGRLRYRAGSARVTAESVNRLISSRSSDNRPPSLPHAAQGPVAGSTRLSREEKVELDLLRAEVRAERSRNRRLLDVAAELVELLRESSAAADRLDDVAGKYSDALTQLLGPEDAAELFDGKRARPDR